MKRIASLIAVAVVLTFGAFQSKAQEEPKRKTPRLSMDNFEGGKMIMPPVKNSGETETKSADSTLGGYVSVNARTVLENTFAQLEKVKSLRMRMKITTLQNEERETIIETVLPNRTRFRSNGVEMIRIGTTVYYRTNTEPWKTKTDAPNAAEAFNPKDMLQMALSAPGISLSAWIVGEEVLAGTPTTVYEITIEEKKNNDKVIPSTIRLWIGKNDKLPRKMNFSSPNAELRMSVSYADFNTNIVINAPRM
jgi:hypothetical protein